MTQKLEVHAEIQRGKSFAWIAAVFIKTGLWEVAWGAPRSKKVKYVFIASVTRVTYSAGLQPQITGNLL